MRDHTECEDAINRALAAGKDGLADFIATRCDQHHGNLTEPDNDEVRSDPTQTPTESETR